MRRPKLVIFLFPPILRNFCRYDDENLRALLQEPLSVTNPKHQINCSLLSSSFLYMPHLDPRT